MAPSPLICVPPKSTAPVDFGPSLAPLLRSLYSVQPAQYATQLATLNRARQDALRGSAGSDDTGRDLLLRWFGMLELLELRFTDVRVPFPWNDAFTSLPTTQSSLAYEKASVLFLLASTYSSLASHSPRSSPESLKRAFVATRSAMGILAYIGDNFLHAPSVDLGREVVGILGRLMEAQGTEIFFEIMSAAPPAPADALDTKAAEAKAGKSAGLKARVCMQASTLYASMIEEVKEWVVKGTFIKEWSELIQTKAKHFASLAQYHASVAALALGNYGMALSRLLLSLTLAKEAQVLAKRFASIHLPLSAATSLPADAPVVMVEVANAHVTIVTELRAKLEKDNDLIYHDSLPSVTSLPAIEKSSVITALPIHEIYATPATQKLVGPDLFEKLIPMGVVELGSVYTEEMAKLARVEAERTEGADAECEGGLGWIGLPQGLERFKQGGDGLDSLTDPGREVRQWVEEIQAHERSREGPVEHLFTQLAARKSSTANRLATTSSALEQEVQACEALRNQYGAMWEQQPSSGSTRGLRADLAAHKASLAQASSSDEQAARIWDGIKDDVRALASTESVGRLFTETIHAALTATNGGPQATLLDLDVGAEESSEREKQEMRGLVARIQEGVTQLGKIRRERAEVLKDLKERIQSDDISHLLLVNRKSATPSSSGLDPIFVAELEKFRPYQQRISGTIALQASVLAAVGADYKKLTDLPSARSIQSRWTAGDARRRQLVERLGASRTGYDDVRDGLTKGLAFYGELEGLVQRLEQDADEFVSRRGLERDMMKSQVEVRQRLEGPRRTSSGPSPAPPSASAYSPALERGMGGLDLRQPSPYPPTPTYASPPPVSPYAAPLQPYQSMPTTGAFSLGAAPAAPTNYNPYAAPAPVSPHYAPPRPAQNPYAPPPQGYAPPPRPYLPSPQGSALPPPPAPMSYSSYPAPPSAGPYYGHPPPGPAPPPHPYGQPPPQQYGAPPAPPAAPSYGYGPPPNGFGAYGQQR